MVGHRHIEYRYIEIQTRFGTQRVSHWVQVANIVIRRRWVQPYKVTDYNAYALSEGASIQGILFCYHF